MDTKVIILERNDGWSIFETEDRPLAEGLAGLEESLDLCKTKHYTPPYRGESNDFFHDHDGALIYRTEDPKKNELELEYLDGTPFIDFEICPSCKGPAIGRPISGHNCYYCANCDKDINCVPPPEEIGEAD